MAEAYEVIFHTKCFILITIMVISYYSYSSLEVWQTVIECSFFLIFRIRIFTFRDIISKERRSKLFEIAYLFNNDENKTLLLRDQSSYLHICIDVLML